MTATVDLASILLGGIGGALVGVAGTLGGVAYQHRRERLLSAYAAEYDSLLAAQSMLAGRPEYLRLQGLTEADCALLEEARVSCEEAAYLFMSFKAAARWHQITNSRAKSAYEGGHPRRTMLTVEKTRKAWRILKKLIGNKAFKDRMDATIRELGYEPTPD